MGIRLVRGRLFTDADLTVEPGVAIVSEARRRGCGPARRRWASELREPTYRVEPGDLHPKDGWQTVVGVVADVRYRGLNDVRLDLYVPTSQSRNNPQHLMVRTKGEPGDLVAAVRAAVRGVDPNAGVGEAVTMRTSWTAESAPWRFLMRVFVAFAMVAAVLATVGLGVGHRAERVSARAPRAGDPRGPRRRRRRLRGLVIREAAILTASGVVLGAARRDRARPRRRAGAHRRASRRPLDTRRGRRAGGRGRPAHRLAARPHAPRRTNAVDALKAE